MRKSISTKITGSDLCLDVVVRSCQPLRHISYISETVRDRRLAAKDHI